MKINNKKIVLILFLYVISFNFAFASNIEDAENFMKKAKLSRNQEEAYEYVHKARVIYEEEHELNPSDINVLVGLSKVNQMLEDRANAKLYLLKAYNMNPSDPNLQKEMGDFYFSFKEYATAIEYYKLSLASGNLRDFQTNIQTAKCFEKLGDIENASLYYNICNHLDSSSKRVMKKINEYDALMRPDYLEQFEDAKYKYLFKDKPVSETTIIQKEADEIIETINSYY